MAKKTDALTLVTNVLQKTNTTQLLYIVLLMASFLLGYLLAKVQLLEKQPKETAPAQQTQGNTPQAPVAQNPPQQPAGKVNVDTGHLPVLGNKNAKVTIVEFADFRCPFCERWHQDAGKSIIKDYVDTGKAKFAFRHFAFLGPASTTAANASECANEQGKFWDYHNYFYEHQPPESDTSMYTTDKLTDVAKSLGMNESQFKSCLDSTKYAKNVSDDLAAGQKAGVSGTPTVFVNGTILVGAQPYTAFKDLIEKELK